MRTIQEKYNAILEGNFSKSQFVKDAKRELPQFISPFNGYEDTVSILKSKGVIHEAKKSEVPEYDKPAPGYSIEALERAVDYELEGMGLMSQETVSEEDYGKAKKKAEKNLKKDPNHYLHLLSGDSKKVDKHDKYIEVKKNNHVDTINGLKKAELKESVQSIKEQIVDVIGLIKSKYPEVSNKDIKDFIKMHFADIQAGADPMEEFKEFLSVNPEILNVDEKKGKDHDGDGDIDSDDYMAAKDKAIKKAMGKKVNEADHNFKEGDKVSVFMRGTKANGPEEVTIVAMDPSGVAIVKNVEGQEDEVFIKDMQPVQHVKEVEASIEPQKLQDMGYRAGEKALMDLDSEIFNQPHFDSYASGFIKGFQDNIEASQDYAAHYVNEGRRRKMKGGKVVTENDYETGGYVESMGPMLDKVLKQLIAVWDEWKEGPMTEPGMVPFAKKDLVSYIDSKISEGEDIVEDSIEENENIKEAFKAIITKVLSEEVITEAATGNLSNIASQYSDFEGMQSAVNDLENIVTDIESYYAKTKEKIQKVYDSFKDIRNAEGLAVGAMLGPAIEAAFKKDLIPVKGFTDGLEMPKVKMLETDGIAEEELEEKETVFKPINEALNKELRKFGPDLKKRLEAAGFKTGLFSGENMVPVEAQKKIQNDPSLAGIAYNKYPNGYEFLEVSVNKSKADELVKVAKYFSTPEGQYGPDKDAGWVVKNVRNVNTGDIFRSKLGGVNNLATITYFRAEEAGSRMGTDKIKSTDKIAAEGKKYKYSKRK